MIRTVTATRYVTPLREGGSLPAVVEADDDGLYVVKFRAAGQGPRALVAELVAGEIGRALGLLVPDIVLVEVDPAIGRAEPHEEIRELVTRSGGRNIGLDFLPGALAFDPAVGPIPDRELAAAIVWFDALVTNIDRTIRNPNLLVWHHRAWLIDHGAALYVHHTWRDPAEHARRPFPQVRDHILLPFAGSVADADERLAPMLTTDLLQRIVSDIPDDWLVGPPAFPSPDPSGQRTSSTSGGGSRSPARSSRRPTVPVTRRSPFEYAIVRVVPRVERGECFNAGIVLYCRSRRFLGGRIRLDPAKLAALAPGVAPSEVEPHLEGIVRICAGEVSAGPIAGLSQSERFHWLVAPSSTMIQPSEVHGGLTDDPAATLDHLFATLVAGPGAP